MLIYLNCHFFNVKISFYIKNLDCPIVPIKLELNYLCFPFWQIFYNSADNKTFNFKFTMDQMAKFSYGSKVDWIICRMDQMSWSNNYRIKCRLDHLSLDQMLCHRIGTSKKLLFQNLTKNMMENWSTGKNIGKQECSAENELQQELWQDVCRRVSPLFNCFDHHLFNL